MTIREVSRIGVVLFAVVGVQQAIHMHHMRSSYELEDGVIFVGAIGLEFSEAVGAVWVGLYEGGELGHR